MKPERITRRLTRARNRVRFSGPPVPSGRTVLIGIGANLRRPGLGALTALPVLAAERLRLAGLRPRRLSRIYRSRSLPSGLGPSYVNAVVLVQSGLEPAAILARLQAIERAFGRRRGKPNEPRPLDLDLLAVGERILKRDGCPVLPHPRLIARAFVLRPIQDVLPTWRHPVNRAPLRSLIAQLPLSHEAWLWARSERPVRRYRRLKTH